MNEIIITCGIVFLLWSIIGFVCGFDYIQDHRIRVIWGNEREFNLKQMLFIVTISGPIMWIYTLFSWIAKKIENCLDKIIQSLKD